MIEVWKLTSRHEDAALSENAGGAAGAGAGAGVNNTDFSRLKNGADGGLNSNLGAGTGGNFAPNSNLDAGDGAENCAENSNLTSNPRGENPAPSAPNSNLDAGAGAGAENRASNSNLGADALTERHKAVIRFSTCIGHGVGTIDFSSKVAEFSEAQWAGFLDGAGEWARRKLGNVNRYFEIEVSLPQAARAAAELPPSELRDLLASLREGYFTIRKSSFC